MQRNSLSKKIQKAPATHEKAKEVFFWMERLDNIGFFPLVLISFLNVWLIVRIAVIFHILNINNNIIKAIFDNRPTPIPNSKND